MRWSDKEMSIGEFLRTRILFYLSRSFIGISMSGIQCSFSKYTFDKWKEGWMIKWGREQTEKKGKFERVVLRNIKETFLRYYGNKRYYTLRFENTIQLKQSQRFCRILSASTDFFVPLGTQGVLLSLTYFAFWFPYWISPATLSLDHTCFSFLNWFCSLWLQT